MVDSCLKKVHNSVLELGILYVWLKIKVSRYALRGDWKKAIN